MTTSVLDKLRRAVETEPQADDTPGVFDKLVASVKRDGRVSIAGKVPRTRTTPARPDLKGYPLSGEIDIWRHRGLRVDGKA